MPRRKLCYRTWASPSVERVVFTFPGRTSTLSCASLQRLRCGIEKESLRVTPDARLATTPHPRGLGSPLTHPHVTTDFSESQVEMVTAPHMSAAACLEELTHHHQVVYRHIGDELLWCASMPCNLPADDAIPIAKYGTSNMGRAKTVYRLGLAHRYGRRMQTISGIHYNFSLPASAWPELRWEPNDGYFSLIRNFRRHSWLLLYLFGASPALCAGFVEGRPHNLETLGADTLYAPHATSLRMGSLGYQSDAQASLSVRYNSLEDYADALEGALTGSHPAYEAIGIRDGDDYRQLATSLLQIENEFYGTIRPKCRTRPGERPLHALRARGIEYVEVRAMDLDPFCPVGIDADTMRFLDLFLLHCLLAESPPDTAEESAAIARNQYRVSELGRQPRLKLERRDDQVELSAWALQILDECQPIAAALDAHAGSGHTDALSAALACVRDPSMLPSARMLDAMVHTHAGRYAGFVLAQSEQHARALSGMHLPDAVRRRYARIAQRSLAEQREIETADVLRFEDFRREYVSRTR
jgi:glutamate--cysteine ligase